MARAGIRTAFRQTAFWRTAFWTLAIGGLPAAAHADWRAVETTKTYGISGTTAPALYAAIGAHGPQLGGGRVIAHTTFKLTWTRNYQPQASSCVLVSAVPKLTIIYTLPKPSSPLPPALNGKWQTFIDGVAAHERVHGGYIRDMVREIETTSIGFTVADDPDCRKIRVALTKQLGEISARERQRNRDFDAVEMGPGGTVQQLILAFVNG